MESIVSYHVPGNGRLVAGSGSESHWSGYSVIFDVLARDNLYGYWFLSGEARIDNRESQSCFGPQGERIQGGYMMRARQLDQGPRALRADSQGAMPLVRGLVTAWFSHI
jgi:hypothetical protein